MNIVIYLVIIVLFTVLLFWTWNSTRDFEDEQSRVIYIVMGLIILNIITFILFNISKLGIKYESKEILREIRRIIILIFVPINGYITLPHVANIKTEISLKNNDDEKTKKKIIILGIIVIFAIIFEIIYLRNFQNGIIKILNARNN